MKVKQNMNPRLWSNNTEGYMIEEKPYLDKRLTISTGNQTKALEFY